MEKRLSRIAPRFPESRGETFVPQQRREKVLQPGPGESRIKACLFPFAETYQREHEDSGGAEYQIHPDPAGPREHQDDPGHLRASLFRCEFQPPASEIAGNVDIPGHGFGGKTGVARAEA